MRITNRKNGRLLAEHCDVAGSFLKRFKGLMGKKSLVKGQGLLILPCNSIHMFFMRFPIDAVFLDKNNKIVRIEKNLKPWSVSKPVFRVNSVLELPSGAVSETGTETGDTLVLE